MPIGDLRATRPPATRDQADAYRFGLRRLEAALVRGDPVPLHEQLRSQRRAALVGVVLALLGLCGAAVYAKFVPRPDWRSQTVVVGAGSGALYVVAHGPDRLVPVANLPAARLVLAALRQNGGATATAVTVPDEALADAPRTPTAAVPGAIAVRPDTTLVPRWAVCDRVTSDGRSAGTTVIGGAAPLPPVPDGDGVLLTGPDDTTWLVTGGHRHRVDVGDGALLAALGLTGRLPRPAPATLLSLLPEGPVLATPDVPGRGGPAPRGLPGRVGDVLVARPVGGGPREFVVTAGGLREVPPVPAELLRVASGAAAPTEVGPDVIAAATVEPAVTGWPAAAPRLPEPAEAPVLCWTWTAGGDPAGDVWLGAALPVAPGTAPVALAGADGGGERVDAVSVGAGGTVRATGPGRAPDAGPLWLLSATGVAHGVADDATAAALGVTQAEPAPEAALRLLPTGAVLDVAQAGRVVDVLPVGG